MSNFGDHPAGFFGDSSFYNGAVSTSLKFDRASAHYLSRDQGSAGNQKVFTLAFWVKRGIISVADTALFGVQTDGNNRVYMRWEADDTFKVYFAIGGSAYDNGTTMKFRDTSAWYHIAVVVNMSGSGDTGKLKIYVNGVNQTVTYNSTLPDSNTAMNSGAVETLGKKDGAANYMDGYLADVYLIDGTAVGETSGYLDEFGEVKEGIWIPKKYTGSYGTNGFHLEFTSSAHDAPASEGSADTDNIGADSSGQNHHWTAVDSISASDCAMPDSPENNFSTLTPLFKEYATSSYLTEGNLKYTMGTSGVTTSAYGSMAVNQNQGGKWYAEVRIDDYDTGSMWVGVFRNLGLASKGNLAAGVRFSGYAYKTNGNKTSTENNGSSYGNSYGTGNVIGIALDLDNDAIYFYKDGTIQNSGTAAFTSITTNRGAYNSTDVGDGNYIFGVDGDGGNVATFNFGQDSTFNGQETAGGNADANGLGDFHTAVPSGYLAVCSANLPELDIGPNSSTQADDHFNTVTYTGTGSSGNAINTVGFQTDWLWIKRRNGDTSHRLIDSSRGVDRYLSSDTTNAEDDATGIFTSFDTNGFTVEGTANSTNGNNQTYVAWNWKANGGTTTTNDASATGVGSIDSVYQANTTAGFSIVTYTGTGSAGTVAHGLGAVPKMLIVRNRSESYNWKVYHAENTSAPETDYLVLDNTDATADNVTHWADTEPTSTVFSLGTSNALIKNTNTFVAYCFAEIEGYSKFGSYTGNATSTPADGAFVYTSFKPLWLMVKRTDLTGQWRIYDTKRSPINYMDELLSADSNATEAEGSTSRVDFLSNGFKMRGSASGTNKNGGTYIYMAFAEAPFKYANAR